MFPNPRGQSELKSTVILALELQSLKYSFSNSLIIHQVETKEIMTMTVFGYLILISIDFYDFIFPFSP
jgi:hypothetical protein